ncbi:Intraflagellar transport protein 52, partial [Quaeritorhiza haematococci]
MITSNTYDDPAPLSRSTSNTHSSSKSSLRNPSNSFVGGKAGMSSSSQRSQSIPMQNQNQFGQRTQPMQMQGGMGGMNSNLPTVLFSIAKKEMFTPSGGLKGLQRRLRNHFKIALYKEEMNAAKLSDAALLVFGTPREKFSTSEFTALKSYLDRGGSILYLASEGGESQALTNFNYLIEEYGMMVNPDAVARTVYSKYFHPKEALITNGILNREINRAAGKRIGPASNNNSNLPSSLLNNGLQRDSIYGSAGALGSNAGLAGGAGRD